MELIVLLLYTLFSMNYFYVSAQQCLSSSSCDVVDQVCCDGECVNGVNCNGYHCSSDSDCSGFGDVCCFFICTDDCGLYTIIAVFVFAALFLILVTRIIKVFCCRRRPQTHESSPILEGRREGSSRTSTTTRTDRPVPSYNQQGPYEGHEPYAGYQQGYAQPPPPEYPGYGATNERAYQSGSNVQPPMMSSAPTAQSPPYAEVPRNIAVGKGNTDQKSKYTQA